MSLLKKEIREFPSRAEAEKFAKDNYEEKPPIEYPSGYNPEQGFLRWKSNTKHVTWGRVPDYTYAKVPLREEDKKLQEDLDKSITPEAIKEWGTNEMLRHVRKDYELHPNATGYDEFPSQKKTKTYVDGITGEKYTK